MSTENRQPKQLLLLDSVWSAEHKMCSNVTEYFMNTIYNAFFDIACWMFYVQNINVTVS